MSVADVSAAALDTLEATTMVGRPCVKQGIMDPGLERAFFKQYGNSEGSLCKQEQNYDDFGDLLGPSLETSPKLDSVWQNPIAA